jgi:hypothetical protein
VVESGASVADDAVAAEEAGNGIVKTGDDAGSSNGASD